MESGEFFPSQYGTDRGEINLTWYVEAAVVVEDGAEESGNGKLQVPSEHTLEYHVV